MLALLLQSPLPGEPQGLNVAHLSRLGSEGGQYSLGSGRTRDQGRLGAHQAGGHQKEPFPSHQGPRRAQDIS